RWRLLRCWFMAFVLPVRSRLSFLWQHFPNQFTTLHSTKLSLTSEKYNQTHERLEVIMGSLEAWVVCSACSSSLGVDKHDGEGLTEDIKDVRLGGNGLKKKQKQKKEKSYKNRKKNIGHSGRNPREAGLLQTEKAAARTREFEESPLERHLSPGDRAAFC
ncbi:hypothetical protein O181_078696, partial [Austropuccinia psidii MF-1]|nr:hypothetical protein [Austropuccinia psidii MF-1]